MALRMWASSTANALRLSSASKSHLSPAFSLSRCFSTVLEGLKYATSHEWVKVEGPVATIGITDHAQEKPHLFQFVPNEKQVKEANKLLKTISQNGGRKRVDGVPVFSAQNLDIAIATTDGIKWYTPYFFDKNMLDSILEESVDQHFHSLIQTRNLQRRRDVIDDNLAAEMTEETAESVWEPPE